MTEKHHQIPFVIHDGSTVLVDPRTMQRLKLTNGQEIDLHMLGRVIEENLRATQEDLEASTQH